MSGLCSAWATETDLPETCSTTAIKPDTLTEAFWYASTILFNLTQRRFPGLCSDVYVPFHDCSTSRCDCGEGNGLRLPSFPVREITSIVLDGVTLDPADYVLHDRRWVRRRGIEGWPCGCDLDDEDRFIVEYVWGRAPTRSLVRAAALLGYEFALGWTPDCASRCRLPKRITSITREGVSMAIVDPLTLFRDGLTGLPDVDALLQSELIGQARQQPVVLVPGRDVSGTRF